jgi:hypothetical protein
MKSFSIELMVELASVTVNGIKARQLIAQCNIK